jgi:hypothetical protein
MIHQYDHRFATFDDSTGTEQARDATSEEHEDPDFVVVPRYWVSNENLNRAIGDNANWLICLRGIADTTNSATMICSAIPRAVAGNSIVVFLGVRDVQVLTALIANLNSLVLDYIGRIKRSNPNLNFYILKQLPVLPPETYTRGLLDHIVPRVLELTYTAWDLAPFARDLGYEGDPYPWDEERRALLRAELDGIYAHLYGLNRDDFDYILGTFPIVNRNDVKAHGEESTRRLCLAAYDYFSKPAQTRLWETVREIETRLSQFVVRRLHNDIASVPEHVQAGQEAERQRQGKPPRADSLAGFLEAGYLTLLSKVIKANREQFADLFASNGQVDAHLSPLIGLRNTLAHTKEAMIADKVRRAGEAEVGWFAEKLGLEIDLVPAPTIER